MFTQAQKQKQQPSRQRQQPQNRASDMYPQVTSNQALLQLMSQQNGNTEQSTPMNPGDNAELLAKIKSRSVNRSGNATVPPTSSVEQKPNTGIPAQMKEKFEEKSGFSYDDVKVHYNSDKPEELGALAYTQGNQVYVAPGQEEHLEHELGHVAQQKAGMVRATGSIDGVAVNDDVKLENYADGIDKLAYVNHLESYCTSNPLNPVIQAKWQDHKNGILKWDKLRGGMRWYYVPKDGTMFFIVEDESKFIGNERLRDLAGYQNKQAWSWWKEAGLFADMDDGDDDLAIEETSTPTNKRLWTNAPAVFYSENIDKDSRQSKGDNSEYIVGEHGLMRYKSAEKETIIHEDRHICYMLGAGDDPFTDARAKAFALKKGAEERIELVEETADSVTVLAGPRTKKETFVLSKKPLPDSRVVDFDYTERRKRSNGKSVGHISRGHVGHPVGKIESI